MKARRPGVGAHYLRYSLGSLLVMIAGFVSFPILTRLLDNTQYGIMGYFNTWVLIAIALAKLGGQHAIMRFYPHDHDAQSYTHFSTNLVVLPMALSFTLWATVALGLLAWEWSGQGSFSSVFWAVVLLTPVLVMGSFVQMVVRASERSGLVMVTRVAGRYLELSLVIAFVILIERSALAVFQGRMVAGAVLLAYFIYWSVRNLRFSRKAIDLAAMATALGYGLPLMINEFAAMALVASDRILIKELTGDFAAVGIYTVGYALAQQINLFMNAALSEAFVPVANRVYGTEGEDAVRDLKARMLLPIVYASIGIAVMVLAIGQEAIVALAGADKAESGRVFMIVGTVMALYPMFDIAGYGLLLKKRSKTVLLITAGATAISIGTNLILIPKYGYMGAAYATVISYAALWSANFFWCPRGLLRLPDARTVTIALGSAAVLLAVIEGTDLFGIGNAWARVFAGGGLFLLLYALPVWLLDARLRAVLPKFRRGGV
ncbi:oligosaccharide flippase family protein [Lysobacter korlensis]|uniref:Oligosaccharide flippase family protein n=1 Tax=Lysobacter korlensis TaxID=553636 RepID=A0ABV6RQ67_9GAMM